uniref:Uncharacterized protein n=1 Tax=Solanum tuberosum TaxID=4113 RepID=M1CMY4_SOLTU
MRIRRENQALYRFRLASSKLFEYKLLNQRGVSMFLPSSKKKNKLQNNQEEGEQNSPSTILEKVT